MKKLIITVAASADCLALCAAVWLQNEPSMETPALPIPPAVIAAQPEVPEMPEIEEIIMPNAPPSSFQPLLCLRVNVFQFHIPRISVSGIVVVHQRLVPVAPRQIERLLP